MSVSALHSIILLCFIVSFFPEATRSSEVVPSAQIFPIKYTYSTHDTSNNHGTGRRLLRKGDNIIKGDLWESGYFYTYLSFGTPPQRFKLVLDTGSGITHVACASCKSCGKHQGIYDMSLSRTGLTFKCSSDYCRWQTCDRYARCIFDESHSRGNSMSGMFVSDVVTFDTPTVLNQYRITFGCREAESGLFFEQDADGMLGLGRGTISLMNQLADAEVMKEIFAVCFRGLESGDGVMIIGEFTFPTGISFTSYDPFVGESVYKLYLSQITIAGEVLGVSSNDFSRGYGVVIDTGTTYSYLPKSVYSTFTASIESNIKQEFVRANGPDNYLGYTCYSNFTTNFPDLSSVFPEMEFIFQDYGIFKLGPENYLFKHPVNSGVYCLSFFQNSETGVILGASAFGNVLLTFHQTKHQIGFYNTDCLSLSSELGYRNDRNPPPAPPPPPLPPPPPAPSPPPSPSFSPLSPPLSPASSPQSPETPLPTWPPGLAAPPDFNNFLEASSPSVDIPPDDPYADGINITQILASLPTSVTQNSGFVQNDSIITTASPLPSPALPPAIGSANLATFGNLWLHFAGCLILYALLSGVFLY